MAADDVTHHFVPEQGGSCDPLATLSGDGPTGQQLDADGTRTLVTGPPLAHR